MAQPMSIIRGWQLDQLRKAPTIVGYIIQATPAANFTTYRDGGNGWTALEALAHLWDFEPILRERVRLTLAHDTPDLPFPSPDTLAAEKSYNQQPVGQVYEEWTARRQNLLALYEGVAEEQWSREARHPRRGLITVSDQLILTAWHDNNHIEQMVRTLAEKRTG